MRHAVAQRLNRPLQGGDTALTCRQSFCPTRKPPCKSFRLLSILRAQVRCHSRLSQNAQQCGLRPFGERLWLDFEGGRDIEQELAADSAAVVLD